MTDDTGMGGTLRMSRVSSVVWTDDDGTKYRRVTEDGEIRDIPIGRSRYTAIDQNNGD